MICYIIVLHTVEFKKKIFNLLKSKFENLRKIKDKYLMFSSLNNWRINTFQITRAFSYNIICIYFIIVALVIK